MEPLGELAQTRGLNKIGSILGRLDSEQNPFSDLFSKVLAAKVQGLGEQVKSAGPPPPAVELVPAEDSSRPLEAIREEIKAQGRKPEEVQLPPHKKEEVTEFLTGLGLAPEEAREVVEKASDENGFISLGRVLESVAEHRRQSSEDGPTLPAGLAPQILVLAEKMGLREEKLNQLAQALGQESISLKKLANILKLAGSPPSGLKGEDLEGVKELLVKAGLPSDEAERMIERRLDSQGRLTLPRLANLLQEVVQKEDQAAKMVSSGRLGEVVAKLLEGAETKPVEPGLRPLAAKSMEQQLNELKAGQAAEEGQGKNQEAASAKAIKDLESPQERAQEKGQGYANPQNQSQAKGQAQDQSSGQTKRGSNQTPPLNIPGRSQGGEESPKEPRFEQQVRSDRINVQIQPGWAKVRAEAGSDPAVKGQTAEPVRPTAEAGRIASARPAGPAAARAVDQVSLASARPQVAAGAQTQAAAPQAASSRSQPSVLLEQLSGKMTLMLKSGRPSMRIQLNPPELGGLKINLRVDGQSVRATIITENQQVQQLLGSNSSDLRQSLADQGFNLDQFDVLTQGGNGGDSGSEPRQELPQTAGEGGAPAVIPTLAGPGRVDLMA